MHSSTSLIASLILIQVVLYSSIPPGSSNCAWHRQPNPQRTKTPIGQSQYDRPHRTKTPIAPSIGQSQYDRPQRTKIPTMPPIGEPQFGTPRRFCSLFGCDCIPPAGARCCTGYRYDQRSQQCRLVV